MKSWKLSSETELFDKIENSSKNVEISYTSDEYNEFVYLVKIKKVDNRSRIMIGEIERRIHSVLDLNKIQLINELNSRIQELENRHREEIKKINDQIDEKFANFNPQLEVIDYSPFFKDFNKKIDVISKKIFKLEADMMMNKLNLKKISTLPEIKRELKIQQKLVKATIKLN